MSKVAIAIGCSVGAVVLVGVVVIIALAVVGRRKRQRNKKKGLKRCSRGSSRGQIRTVYKERGSVSLSSPQSVLSDGRPCQSRKGSRNITKKSTLSQNNYQTFSVSQSEIINPHVLESNVSNITGVKDGFSYALQRLSSSSEPTFSEKNVYLSHYLQSITSSDSSYSNKSEPNQSNFLCEFTSAVNSNEVTSATTSNSSLDIGKPEQDNPMKESH
jgi:hypothetical protein